MNTIENDELLPQAIKLVVEEGQASISFIQRKFRLGYVRAAKIIEQLEQKGVISVFNEDKPRTVLPSK